jgi:hypothetical protein
VIARFILINVKIYYIKDIKNNIAHENMDHQEYSIQPLKIRNNVYLQCISLYKMSNSMKNSTTMLGSAADNIPTAIGDAIQKVH